MLDDTTRPAADRTDGPSDYGPFHLELDPLITGRVLARARRLRDARQAAMHQDLGFRITHWLYGRSLEFGRFLHHHNFIRGIPH
ncbi:MAG: hypothetical protein GVY13_05195 [Alphaproteobacteria bacterium]|jgi:hypothetical protein|nr:hypothetical protein [Alphaproteobacteria bacterium]